MLQVASFSLGAGLCTQGLARALSAPQATSPWLAATSAAHRQRSAYTERWAATVHPRNVRTTGAAHGRRIGSVHPRDVLAVEVVIVLLHADGAPQPHLRLVGGQAVVAVVKHNLHVRAQHVVAHALLRAERH